MLNKVMIIGRLGQDPELRYTQSGMPMLNISVATDESYTDRDGNRQEKTEWHRVAVFDRAAENCASFLHKGSLVFIEGRLQTRKWQDAQGQERQMTEIRAQRVQFLDRKSDRNQYDGEAQPQYARSAPQEARQTARPRGEYNDRKYNGPEPRRKSAGAAEPEPAYPSEFGAEGPDEVPF